MSNKSRNLTLRFLAEPTDVNFGGKVHGGIVMKWIDQAGYACATQWSGNYCVTVYVGGIRFLKPIVCLIMLIIFGECVTQFFESILLKRICAVIAKRLFLFLKG